jgi:SAM-dependent methyltransferase
VLLDLGAEVTSIDLSEAVDANAENLPIGERHRIAQADILQLPFAGRQFDVVFCLGVIQHTPDPEETITRLYEHVKPGGRLVIDHYRFRWRWYLRTAPYLRWVLKRVSPEKGVRATTWLVDRFLPLHRRFHSTPVVSSLLNRVSPVLHYYRDYPQLDDRLQREWALLDTHDALTDWYKHYRSRQAIRKHLEQLGLVDVWVENGGNGVEARGRRPRCISAL